MARKLEAFPAAPFASKYPWDQLLDGEPWECMQGEDFESRLGTFLANARAPPADPRAPRVPRGPRANDGGQPDRTRSSSRDVRSAALGRSVHLESAPTTPSGPTESLSDYSPPSPPARKPVCPLQATPGLGANALPPAATIWPYDCTMPGPASASNGLFRPENAQIELPCKTCAPVTGSVVYRK